jgi:hypothetical protein
MPIDPGLANLIAAWPDLAKQSKRAILALIDP